MYRLHQTATGLAGPPPEQAAPSSSLLDVVWRRRWLLVGTVAACLAIAAGYLLACTPVYRSSARLLVDLNTPRAHAAAAGNAQPVDPDTYVQAHVDALQSTAVLSRGLASLDYRAMQTFAKAQGDPVEFVRQNKLLNVARIKKSDTIEASIDAEEPKEAAAIVSAIVDAYLTAQREQRQQTGGQVLAALKQEKADVDERLGKTLAAMKDHQQKHGVASFRNDDKANTVADRTATLARSLTEAQIAGVELRARKQAVSKALENPGTSAGFVASQLMKDRETGDREYGELRAQLVQTEMALAMCRDAQGANSRQVRALEARVGALKEQIADKEYRVAQAHLADLTTQLAAADERAQQLRAALDAQRGDALTAGAGAIDAGARFAEAERLRKQSDLLDDRILEITVNSMKSGPLDVRVTEPARAQPDPIKPQKKLVLLGAALVGWVLGLALVTVREWQDARVHDPDEAIALLGAPVLAMVPRINAQLSPVTRGQLVRLDARSPVAEAYRTVRTALRLTAHGHRKTILIASSSPGEGKSTTASNLAIAFAQAGERTLLVDCDLREPVQHLMFESDGSVGLTSVLAGEVDVASAIRATRVPHLHVLPCGPIPRDPSEQLADKRFDRVMQKLAESFDRIIIDSPPVMSVTDAQILAAAADATLLVLRMNWSARQVVLDARDALERVGANLVGIVANDVSPRRAYRYYGGSWQYAAHANRLLSVEGDASSGSHANGVDPKPAPERRPAAEVNRAGDRRTSDAKPVERLGVDDLEFDADEDLEIDGQRALPS